MIHNSLEMKQDFVDNFICALLGNIFEIVTEIVPGSEYFYLSNCVMFLRLDFANKLSEHCNNKNLTKKGM